MLDSLNLTRSTSLISSYMTSLPLAPFLFSSFRTGIIPLVFPTLLSLLYFRIPPNILSISLSVRSPSVRRPAKLIDKMKLIGSGQKLKPGAVLKYR